MEDGTGEVRGERNPAHPVPHLFANAEGPNDSSEVET